MPKYKVRKNDESKKNYYYKEYEIEKYGKILIIKELFAPNPVDSYIQINVKNQKTPYAVSKDNEFFLFDKSISGYINKVKSLDTENINGAIDNMYLWNHLEEGTYTPMSYDLETR